MQSLRRLHNMHKEMLSAEVVCCICLLILLAYLSVEANSLDRKEQSDLDVHCLTRGFFIFFADDKNR